MGTARVPKLLGAASVAGACALAYGVGYERNAFTLRRIEVPVLATGAAPLRVLHLSDLHMLDRQRAKQEWIRDLGRLLPDLVVLTGDVLSGADAGPSVLRALAPLLDRPGIFVPGNNDYYEPDVQEPAALPDRQPQRSHRCADRLAGLRPRAGRRRAGRT